MTPQIKPTTDDLRIKEITELVPPAQAQGYREIRRRRTRSHWVRAIRGYRREMDRCSRDENGSTIVTARLTGNSTFDAIYLISGDTQTAALAGVTYQPCYTYPVSASSNKLIRSKKRIGQSIRL